MVVVVEVVVVVAVSTVVDVWVVSVDGELVVVSVDDGVVTVTFSTCRVRVSARRGPGEPFLRLTADIDNDAPDHRLVAALELGSPCETSTAGAPFEIVTRFPRGEGGASEPPARQWPARGFVRGDREGFLSEGVVEYELLDHYTLAVTLLRCTGTISRQGALRERAVRAGPDVATPDAQMIGHTTIPFGVFAGYDDPIELWERYALPLLVGGASGADHAPLRGALLDVDAPALSSVRKRGGTTEARVWNPWPDAVDARIGGEWMSLGPHRVEVVELAPPSV